MCLFVREYGTIRQSGTNNEISVMSPKYVNICAYFYGINVYVRVPIACEWEGSQYLCTRVCCVVVVWAIYLYENSFEVVLSFH